MRQRFIPYARTRDLLADLFGVTLAVGPLVNLVRHGATQPRPVADAIRGALRAAAVLQHGETGLRVAGPAGGAGWQWTQVTRAKHLTYYARHPARGATALEAIDLLPGYMGVSVHDGWTSYRHFTACRHAVCDAHHPRELTFVAEELGQAWAGDLKAPPREMRAAVETARTGGATRVEPDTQARCVARYEAPLATGVAQNPQPLPGGESDKR